MLGTFKLIAFFGVTSASIFKVFETGPHETFACCLKRSYRVRNKK